MIANLFHCNHHLILLFHFTIRFEWRVIPYCSNISETTETSELNVGGHILLNSRIAISFKIELIAKLEEF